MTRKESATKVDSEQSGVRRVLMTADAVGGVWTYALELVRALQPWGVEVLLATMGGPVSAQQQQEAAEVGNVTLREGDYKLEWMSEPWDDVRRAGDWLLSLAHDWRPDVVHLNGFAHAVLPFGAPKIVVAHSCVLSWWRAVHGQDAPREYWATYRNAVAVGLRAADHVVAPTRAMLSALPDLYDVELPHSSVISNARDASLFLPPPPAIQIPACKEPFVFAAGRLWDEAKNIGALAQSAGNGLAWPVLVAGDTRHPDAGKHDASARFANVKLLGKLAPVQVAGWMRRAAIYALPARYEPFGLSALEAALSGCALVLGDIPSLREVWGRGETDIFDDATTDEDCALFVPPNDAGALRAALQNLIECDSLRDELARRAFCRARHRYTPERMAQQYMCVCDTLQAQQITRVGK